MSRQAAYASIMETIEDCQALLAYINKHHLTNVRVITLSLEAYRYLLREPRVQNIHIWKLLDMETLLHQAFLDAQQAAAEWVSLFPDEHNLFDVAVQIELDQFTFYHALVCIRVAERLMEVFREHKWTYLVSPLHLIWLSRYFPYHQKHYQHNFLFKAVSLEVLKQAGIKIRHMARANQFKLTLLPLDLVRAFAARLGKDVCTAIVGQFHAHPVIDESIERIGQPLDVIVSGWGSDVSRILSFREFRRQLERYPDLTVLNLIWRPHKVDGFDSNAAQEGNSQAIVIDEEIDRGMAHGPKLCMFPLRFLSIFLYKFVFTILPTRLMKIYQPHEPQYLLSELLQYESIRISTIFTMFFAYRQAFLHHSLLKTVLEHRRPSVYIGSVSDLTRAERLTAKLYGVSTYSVPHGHQAYSLPAHFYLAETLLVQGNSARQRLQQQGIPSSRVHVIGTSHPRRDSIPKLAERIRVVIGTRSRGGLWSNYCARQDEYDEQLVGLVGLLLSDERFEVVVKSHPNGDYHAYYDLVANESNPNKVKHVSSGWKLDKFVSYCDILVCLGELPSFFISSLLMNIPIVFIESVMTRTQHHLNYEYSNSCQVVQNYCQAYEAIMKLISDDDSRRKLLQRQRAFVLEHIADYPERRLVEHIVNEVRGGLARDG